nr:putative ribonuclease H-like domain-containing protein [Tanacetum cinerariifolium]
TECIVLSPEFKLPDENQVLLRVPRENNMYSVDLKNIVPSGDLTCLFAKATLDESNLWNIRLSHINFKTMNKLVKGNLVRGLPSKVFENNRTCVACKKGKQHRASCKTKPISSVSQPLQRLHMDLFGPTFVKSLNKKSYCLVVTDDYSKFTWVFFLATKDKTSLILKTFITGIEDQLSLKVKIIRSDNGTKFKNQDLNQFCRMKGIKREFSVPRTLQQNGIAERKNMTLIEAAKTMLADLLLPILFWAKAVNTACYVQNRVLVTKPYNKTPYKLLLGRTPSICFMRPFGCPVTILNTLDPLRKFDRKANEGFLVGYSNTYGDATFEVKEPEFEGRKPESEVHVSPSSSAKTKKHDDKTKREAKGKSHVEFTPVPTVGQISTNNTNTFSAAGPSNTAVSPTLEKYSYVDTSQYLDDPNMPALEDISYSDDEEDVGAEADFTNLETTITASPIPIARVHKDHPVTQIIGDLSSATQTRSMTRMIKDQGGLTQINNEDFHTCMFAYFLSQEETKRVHQALKDPSWIEAMQEELLQFKMQKVWVLVNLPNGKRAICTKWGFRNKKDERGFKDPDYPDKVYKVVKALYGLHQAPRAWYETLANYRLENGFQQGKIDQTLFIKKQKGDILLVQFYVDDIIFGSTNKDLCKDFKKLTKDKFHMSSIGELTFFLVLQVKQKQDGIFISQDKYVAEILRKFGLNDGKSASTPIDTEKSLLKDPDGEDYQVDAKDGIEVSDVYLKLLLSGLLLLLLVRNVDSSSKFYMYPRFLQLMIRAQVGDLSSHTIKYSSPALTQKLFTNMRRVGKGFSEVETPLFERMLVPQQAADAVDDVVADIAPTDDVPAADAEPTPPSPPPTTTPPLPQELPYTSQVMPPLHPSPIAQPSSPPQQQQPSQPTIISMDLLNNLLETYTALTRRVKNLEQDKIAQALEIIKLMKRVKKLEKKRKLTVFGLKRLRKVGTTQRVESSADTGRLEESQAKVYHIDLEHADKVLSMHDDEPEPAELQEVVIRDPEETATPSTIIHSEPKSKDKGKGIMVKKPKPLKKQAQIEQDEAYAREKNMMVYLKNMAGFKIDYFKGMSYDDIRPIFEKYFDSNVVFLKKRKEQLEEEESRALNRASESLKEKAAKKQKLDEEAEEVKKHLPIVPNDDDDDVYTEATPLALKMLWKIIQERFASSEPKNFSDDFLLTTLTYMFEKPDVEAQVWKNQRGVHDLAKFKSWRLLESCGVHIITFITTQMILLVERRYPLTRFTLEQMLNNVKLEVDEESKMSLELLRFIRQQQQEEYRPE